MVQTKVWSLEGVQKKKKKKNKALATKQKIWPSNVSISVMSILQKWLFF